MSYVGCIIQARLTSTRFPRKILAELEGLPVLEHVVNRCHQAKLVDKVIIAAPHSPECCLNESIFIGSEHDVLDRYYKCAKEYNLDIVVRITADCPLIPPTEIDRVICELIDKGADYATNRPAMPDGFDVEAFTMDALTQAWYMAKDSYDREHVTPWIKRNAKMKRLILDAPKLSLDTQDDLKRIAMWLKENSWIGQRSLSS